MSNYMHYTYESAVFTPSLELTEFIKPKFFDTAEQRIEPNNSNIRRIKALLYAIFEEYISNVPTVDERANSNNVVAVLINYLSKNFYQNKTISEVSSEIGYSESYISHNIKKSTDLNFSELRNSFRVDCAKNLLANGEMSTFGVALECGFGSQRTFDRVFKKHTGITPQKYKELHSVSKNK